MFISVSSEGHPIRRREALEGPHDGTESNGGGARGASESTRRVFFAFWPDDAIRAAFARATREAVSACAGRPVPARNLHATLVFLGAVAEQRIRDLEAIADRVAVTVGEEARVAHSRLADANGRAPCDLVFDRIEHWEKPRVLVAAASPSTGLALAGALAAKLFEATSNAGFAPDLKPFRAHVTVARKVARLTHSPDMLPVRWPVTGFALVESLTLPEGPLYSVINLWALDMRRNN